MDRHLKLAPLATLIFLSLVPQAHGQWTNVGGLPSPAVQATGAYTPANATPYARGWLKLVYDPADKKVLFYLANPNCCLGTFSNAIFGYSVGTNTWSLMWSHMTTGGADGVGISSIARSNNVVTVTLSATNMPLYAGSTAAISGVTDASFDGYFTIASAAADNSSFTYNQTGSNANSSGGTAYDPIDSANAPVDHHPYDAMAWDSARNALWMGFGSASIGTNNAGTGVCADCSVTDLYKMGVSNGEGSWTQACGDVTSWCPPGGLQETAFAYDAANDVIVLYGGLTYGSPTADTWLYYPASNTWTQICGSGMSACGPPQLHRQEMVGIGNGTVVMFGGQDQNGTARSDVWLFNTTTKTWSSTSPSVKPPGVMFPPADYVPRLNALVLVDNNTAGAHVWSFSLSTGQWQDLNIATGPTLSNNIANNAGAYDANADRFVLYDGDGAGTIWSLALPSSLPASTPAPAVTLSPTSLSFSSQPTGTTSAAQPIALTNAGTAALTIYSIGIGGTNAADFAQTNNCPVSPATLAASATCTINVTFTPSLASTETAAVSIADNASGSPQSLALDGAGATGSPAPSGSSGSLNVQFTTQAAEWSGLTPGVSEPTASSVRTNAPVTFGVALPDSAGITGAIGSSPTTLELQDGSGNALNGQFRILSHWPTSGNVQWVLVDAQLPSFTERTANTGLQLVSAASGGGNSPAAAMGVQCTGAAAPIAACPDANHIVVQTGTATFSIKERNFDFLDDVLAGSTHLVSSANHAADDGLVLMGPPSTIAETSVDSVSCSNGPSPSHSGTSAACTDEYESALDSTSSCSFDDNGPLRTTVKCMGNLVDSTDRIYLHWTVRETFWASHSDMKTQVSLRNADQDTAGSDFASAYKEFNQFEIRLTNNLAVGSRNFNIGNHTTTPTTGTMAAGSSDEVYLYQAYTNDGQWGDWTGSNCTSSAQGRCIVSYINRTGSAGSWTYAQNGYQIVKNGTQIGPSGTSGSTYNLCPSGWADEDDGTNGIEVGIYQLCAYWPKSLQFESGGNQIRVGIWPDQTKYLPNPSSPQAYVIAWPAYQIHDLYLNFHTGTLTGTQASSDFLDFQNYLITRPANSLYWNSAKDENTGTLALLFPTLDPIAEDTYLLNASGQFSGQISTASGTLCENVQTAGQCESDMTNTPQALPSSPGFAAFRWYATSSPGSGNQHEEAWSDLRNWLERGGSGLTGSQPGRYIWAIQFYRFLAEQAGGPHSDGFSWATLCTVPRCSFELPNGDPTGPSSSIVSWNHGMFADFMDDSEHHHTSGLIDAYYLTGDGEFLDELMQAYKAVAVNGNSQWNTIAYSGNGAGYGPLINARAVGHWLDFLARTSLFLREIGDSNADTASETCSGNPRGPLCASEDIIASEVAPYLIKYGYPVGQSDATNCPENGGGPCSEGVSPVTGMEFPNTNYYSCGGTGGTLPCDGNGHQSNPPFQAGILVNGLIETEIAENDLRGSGWTRQIAGVSNGPLTNLTITLSDNALRDLAFGIGKGVVTNLAPVSGMGLPYSPFLDYLNTTPPCGAGDCTLICNVNCWSTMAYFNWYATGNESGSTVDLGGNSWQHSFEAYLARADAAGEEYLAYMPEAIIGQILAHNPLNPNSYSLPSNVVTLQDVPITVTSSPCCTITWTKPANLSSLNGGAYRLKYYGCTTGGPDCPSGGKQIINWLTFRTDCLTTSAISECSPNPCSGGMDSATGAGCWEAGQTPDTHWNWFASTDVSSEPAAAATSYSFTPQPNTTYTFDLKAWETGGSSGGGTGGGATPPTVSVTSPAAGATVSGTITLSASASSGVAIASVQFEVDSSTVGSPIAADPYSTNWNTTAVANGTHTVTAIATDTAGHTGSASVTIQVNNPVSNPTVSISSPAGGATVSGTIALSASASSSIGIASVQFQVDGSNMSAAIPAAPFSMNWNTTAVSNGAHTVTAIATDTAGHTASASVSVQVNNTAPNPTVSITSPAAGSAVSGTIALSANASSGVGIASVQFEVDGGTVGAAITAAPYSTTWNTTAVSNATHTVTAIATDTAGHTGSASVSVQVNNPVPNPTVSITSPAAGSAVSGTIALSASASSGIGIASVQFQIDGSNFGAPLAAAPYSASWNTAALSNGAHTVTAIATDTAGHTGSASVSVQVNNSTSNPSVSITSPAAGATLSGTVALSASASSSIGIAKVQFQVDGSNFGAAIAVAPYSITWNTTTAGNGSHTVTAIATDTAGHTGSASATVQVNNPVANPAVSIALPAAGATVSGTIALSAIASSSIGIAKVQFQIDGSNIAAAIVTAPYSITWNTTMVTNGSHTLAAIATDTAAHTGSASITIQVNNPTANPTISIVSPLAGAAVSATITLSANASSGIGIANVLFEVDGRTVGNEITSAPYSTAWDTAAVSNGSYTLTAIATDTAGHTNSAALTLQVNNAASPTVAITSPAAGATVSGAATLAANASSSIGIASVQFQVDGSNVGPAIVSTPYSTLWNAALVSNGSHTVTAIATDTAGHTGSASLTLQVNNSPPPPMPAPGSVPESTIDTYTQFIIQAEDLASSLSACSGCQFASASDLVPGQRLQVRLRAGATTTADSIVLEIGALNGTVTSGGSTQFTVQPVKGSVAPASVSIVTVPSVTVFSGFSSTNPQLQVGQTVAVRGLLFKAGPQGSATFLADQVVLSP